MARDRRDRRDDDDSDDSDDARPRRPARRRPRDDDDSDDAPRPARGAAKPDNTVKVLLIVGGLVLTLVLICAGVVLIIYNSVARGFGAAQQKAQQDMTKMAEQQQKEMNKVFDKAVGKMDDDMKKSKSDEANSDKAKATAAVVAFMQEVKGGRAAAAYQMMSPEYRQKTTQATFTELMQANAGDLGRTFTPRADFFSPETGTTYPFDLSIGFKKITVTAIKQGGQWVIDVFTVGPR